MKKQILAAFIAVMTIILLTGCGSPKQLSKSVTVELGNKKGINVTDVIDISEDKAEDAKIDDKKVDYGKKGKYDEIAELINPHLSNEEKKCLIPHT